MLSDSTGIPAKGEPTEGEGGPPFRHQLQLRIRDGSSRKALNEFYPPKVTLGKAPDNDIVLSSVYLSRHHGEFHFHKGQWSYRDLASTNGTMIQARSHDLCLKCSYGFREARLRGGERLRVGNIHIDVVSTGTVNSGQQKHMLHSTSSLHDALHVFDTPFKGGDLLRRLFEAFREIGAGRDRSEVLRSAANAALECIPALTHVFLLEQAPGTDRWLRAWSTSRAAEEEEDGCSISQALAEATIGRGESIHTHTISDVVNVTDSIRRAHIAWSICVPLKGGQGTLGVLQADCRKADLPTSDRDLHIMTLIGDQVTAVLERLQNTQRIHVMFKGFVDASINAIESRDPCTAGHSARVASYCCDIAEWINMSREGPFGSLRFSEEELQALKYAALLHDFGKVGVREGVLLKEHKLTETQKVEVKARFQALALEERRKAAEEKLALREQSAEGNKEAMARIDQRLETRLQWLLSEQGWLESCLGPRPICSDDHARLHALTELRGTFRLLEPVEVKALLTCKGTLTVEERQHIETHASQTRAFLEHIPWSEDLMRVPEIAGHHHERLNGAGYPSGVTADSLPIEARILAVCDIYDALTALDRPYRPHRTPHQALKILEEEVESGAIDGNVLFVLRQVLDADEKTNLMPLKDLSR